MKKFYFCFTLFLIGIVGILTGCKDEIDITDIDTRSELNVGIALPLGSVRATIGDIMTDNPLGPNFYLNENGTLTYQDTTHFDLKLTDFDWGKYVSKSSKTFTIDPTLIPGGIIPGGFSHTFEFPFTMELSEVNKNLNEERFDSILVHSANWTSKVNTRNIDGLQWDWIDKMTIDLGSQCYRPSGQLVDIYVKGQGGNFNVPLSMQIEDFSICLMRNRSLNPKQNSLWEFNTNVINKVTMTFMVTVSVPRGKSLVIGNNAAFIYDAELHMLKHDAIWGYIQPNKALTLVDTLKITEGWNMGDLVSSMKIPFSEPSVKLDMRTQISAYWEMLINSLSSFNSTTREKKYASFDGTSVWRKSFEDQLGLDPSTLGQEAQYSIILDHSESNGHLDNLFLNNPDMLIYDLAFNLTETQKHPQIRIPAVPDIKVDMIAALPLAFNPGVFVTYSDTIPGVNLSMVALDSLLASVQPVEKVKQASLCLVIDVVNDIPLNVTGTFHFLDEDNEDLHLLDDPIAFVAKDSSQHVLELQKKDFDKLAQTKSVFVELKVEDTPLRDKPDLYPIRIEKDNALTLHFGVAGNIDAVLNFNNK